MPDKEFEDFISYWSQRAAEKPVPKGESPYLDSQIDPLIERLSDLMDELNDAKKPIRGEQDG